MSIPLIDAIRSYLQGDGAVILPEMELVLFALGIMLIDFWIEQRDKYLNAVLALAGTVFSGATLWMLRGRVATNGGILVGFHESVVVDGFFLFFSVLFLASTALVILLSVKYLEIEKEQEGEYYALLLFACV